MNIAPSYPNIVPLAQQPATEAARRDSALRERIPQPAETNSGKTANRFGSSADTPPRYVTNTSVATSDTYSLSSLKNSALKTTSDTTLPTTETVTAVSDQSQRKGQTASGDDSSEPNSDQDKQKAKKEEQAVKDLKARDVEVRTHEQAHKTAGGQFAGSPTFDMTKGPDGQSYATGGHVNIDVSAVPNDPQATINKMSQIKSAALAPAEPSAQDLKVAANADSVAAEARSELAKSSTTTTNSDNTADALPGASAQNLSISDDPSINAKMRRRGQIILAHYQSSSRPYA
jgi:hypothetical protein